MNKGDRTGPVSRARYERERRARQEAEAILQSHAKELNEVNQRLVMEGEALRVALAETEAARSREAAALKEQSTLTRALAALAGKSGAAEAMQALLDTLNDCFDGSDACFLQAEGSDVHVTAAAPSICAGKTLPLPVSMLVRPRRLAGLADLVGDRPMPERSGNFVSVIIAPLVLDDESPGALMLASPQEGMFSAADLRLLEHIAGIAAQSLTALREARRNALLVSLIEGQPVRETGGVLDTPLETVHRAFSRMTDMQGTVVGILDTLLNTPLTRISPAIQSALARLGKVVGADRVSVFRLAPRFRADRQHP